MNTPKLHTLTGVPEALAWEAFRAAAEGGGTPPQWTQGEDDPATWHAPPDAAGGLVLWREDGSVDRCEPAPSGDAQVIADRVIADLASAGLAAEVLPGVVRATYASSGGRVVALVWQPECDAWYVAVLRSDGGPPRVGRSEQNVVDLLCPGDARVLLIIDAYLAAI